MPHKVTNLTKNPKLLIKNNNVKKHLTNVKIIQVFCGQSITIKQCQRILFKRHLRLKWERNQNQTLPSLTQHTSFQGLLEISTRKHYE